MPEPQERLSAIRPQKCSRHAGQNSVITCHHQRRTAHLRLTSPDPLASAKAAHLRYVTADGPGISRRRHGKSFTYLGVDARPIRDRATLERIRSLVIPPAWKQVWICPTANGHIQAVGR